MAERPLIRTSRPATPSRRVRETLARREGEARFFAVVTGKMGNRISVRRLDSATSEGPYSASAGLASSVSTGDTVVCEVVQGHVTVAREVVT